MSILNKEDGLQCVWRVKTDPRNKMTTHHHLHLLHPPPPSRVGIDQSGGPLPLPLTGVMFT